MKKHVFKRTLFGYSKRDVCEYIVEKDRQYTQTLTEEDTEFSKTVAELNSKIAALQQENDRLRYHAGSAAGDAADSGDTVETDDPPKTERQKTTEGSDGAEREQLKKLHLYEDRFNEARREWQEITEAFTEYFDGEICRIDQVKKELPETDGNL